MNLNLLKYKNAILNYHRISPDVKLVKPNDELVVDTSRFREQLIFLKKNYNVVSIDQFLNFKKNEKSNICITFDDGYKDNFIHALPILKELNIPATIYIITKFLDDESDVWWLELEDYIWNEKSNIEFSYKNKNYKFSTKNNSNKIKCFQKLRSIIKPLEKEAQRDFLAIVTKNKIRKKFKNEFMSIQDLKLLSADPLITIGAHSHNHLSLKNISKENCVQEIKLSKIKLEALTNKKINHFSYPYGTNNDVGKREFEIVKEFGFKSAVTTSVGIPSREKVFNLPRIHINQKVSKQLMKIKLSTSYIFYKKLGNIVNNN